jgi:subtilisin family serine protease
VKRGSLDERPFVNGTGRGVVIAVVDSGVHASHPHLGDCIIGGESLVDVLHPDDWVDRLGHGTAVAAAIHEKAPDASLFVVRVFDRSLATSAQMLADGIVRSVEHGASLINLSLGTANTAHRDLLSEAVAHAAAHGATVVSAREWNGQAWLPGSLDGVVGVVLDPECDRNEIGYPANYPEGTVYAASGYPRPIPGVPKERNLSGVSFAVANVTGFLARMRGADQSTGDASGPPLS